MIKIPFNDIQAINHANSVLPTIKSRIQKVLDNNGFYKGKKKNIHITPTKELTRFLELLLTRKALEKLIIARPERLRKFIRHTRKSRISFCNEKHTDNEILKHIFITHAYDHKTFSKKDFVDNIKLSTCPYCNRNYIHALDKGKKIKPEIDHFYPKQFYPFLGISYYNLIPSCQTCNGYGGKHNADSFLNKLTHPYEIANDDFLFSYRLISLEKNNPLINSTIEVFLAKKIDINCDIFKLEELYAKHADHVTELIVKSKIKYSKKYIRYLLMFKNLNLSEEEIDRMILGNYAKETQTHSRPLAKLYQDIGKELGLIG